MTLDELNSLIQDVQVISLKQIVDARGAVLHMLRADNPYFARFGEIYFSEVNPGVIKAWKKHSQNTQHFAVPVGRIKVVVYDDRPSSLTKSHIGVYELGRPDAYHLLIIPPMVWYGFQGVSHTSSIIANCTDIPHDPQESENLDESSNLVPFEW